MGPILRSVLLASLLAAGTPCAVAADAALGRKLYEARCDGCHAESVHGRAKRSAADFDGIRGWVRRWSANLGLRWSDSEVDDVSAWLNGRYYRFPCPPSTCGTATGRLGGGDQVALRSEGGAKAGLTHWPVSAPWRFTTRSSASTTTGS